MGAIFSELKANKDPLLSLMYFSMLISERHCSVSQLLLEVLELEFHGLRYCSSYMRQSIPCLNMHLSNMRKDASNKCDKDKEKKQ